MSDMQGAIDDCLSCHVICLAQALGSNPAKSVGQLDADRTRLMLDCAEICQAAANFLARGSDHHQQVCLACVEVCRACAASCQEVGGMHECVEACWRCAATCEELLDPHEESEGDER